MLHITKIQLLITCVFVMEKVVKMILYIGFIILIRLYIIINISRKDSNGYPTRLFQLRYVLLLRWFSIYERSHQIEVGVNVRVVIFVCKWPVTLATYHEWNTVSEFIGFGISHDGTIINYATSKYGIWTCDHSLMLNN